MGILLLSHLVPQDNIQEFMRIAHLTLDDASPLQTVEDIALEHPAPFNQVATRNSRVVHRGGFKDYRHSESNINMAPNTYYEKGVPSSLSRRSTTFGVPENMQNRLQVLRGMYDQLPPISSANTSGGEADISNSIQVVNDSNRENY